MAARTPALMGERVSAPCSTDIRGMRRSSGAPRPRAYIRRCSAGQRTVLVIRGEAGIGKSALLRYGTGQAAGCRVGQIAGVESELELPLPFAAIHQLCAPMLSHLQARASGAGVAGCVRARDEERSGSVRSVSQCSACWRKSPPGHHSLA